MIRGYRDQHGYVPTIREICGCMNISPNAVVCMLRLLRDLGVLDWNEHTVRTIRFIGETPIYVRDDHVERVREFIRSLG
jgi:SOS-response transcriptional repressor LexA